MNKSANIEDVYTLSPLQEGMLFHSIYQQESSAYFVQMAYRLSGDLEVSLVERSFQQLLKRHDILRTSFVYEEMDKPLQIVLKHRELPFHFEDIRGLGKQEEQEEYLEDFKTKDKIRYFNLTKDCLMRVALFRIADKEYELVWSSHHLIVDGWCHKILEYEFFAIYEHLKNNRDPQLPPAPPYKNYIKWLGERSAEAAARYWEQYLKDYDVPVTIPQLIPHQKPVAAYNNNIHVHEIPETLHQTLMLLAQRNRTTLNNIVRTLWGILLAKYNDQRDTVFGAVVSGRPAQLKDSEAMVGMFINTVPVRIAYEEGTSFQELLEKTTKETLVSEDFHYSPLAEIQKLSEQKKQLFDHILVFENYPGNPSIQGLSEEDEVAKEGDFLKLVNENVFSQNHYPFYIIIGTQPKLKFNFYYNKELYSKQLILQFCDQLNHLMEQCISRQDMLIDEMELVRKGSQEYQQLLTGFNATQQNFLLDTSIKEVFEKVVVDFPENLALQTRYNKYTYTQLNQLSNRLAAYLSAQISENPSSRFVGILVSQIDFAVIGMLAAIKAGATFVPIHPDLPVANIENILKETNPALLLVESDRLGQVETFSGELFAMDIQLDMLEDIADNLPENPDSRDPVYTIYSSGTTGQPKGVVISHRSLLNYTYWFKDHFNFSSRNRAALLSSYAFDLGYTTIWGCLLSGAAIYLPDQKVVREPDALMGFLMENEISFLKMTPSHFKILMASSQRENFRDSALRLILLGGEKIHPTDIAQYLDIQPATQFVNHYGPTEATIGTITHRINQQELAAYTQFPLIGQPIANAKAYILDKNRQLLPIGATGDLYLAGEGLAIEYLHQPELTQEKFINSSWEERLYHTGDKARRYAHGGIEFLGRADREVKIRGYRVNTEEIEQVLNQFPRVEFSAVLARENLDSEVSLVAFVRFSQETEMSDLVTFLKGKVPDFMMPGELIAIPEVPLTANGKVDVKQLRKLTGTKRNRQILPPTNELEAKMLEIWKEVLAKEEISIDDDFFDLGGHSLKAVQIISRVISEFQITLAVKDIFDHTTIQGLTKELDLQLEAEQTDRSFDDILI